MYQKEPDKERSSAGSAQFHGIAIDAAEAEWYFTYKLNVLLRCHLHNRHSITLVQSSTPDGSHRKWESFWITRWGFRDWKGPFTSTSARNAWGRSTSVGGGYWSVNTLVNFVFDPYNLLSFIGSWFSSVALGTIPLRAIFFECLMSFFPGIPLPLECIKVRIFCEFQPLSDVVHIQTTTFGFISPMRHRQQSRKCVLVGHSPVYLKFRLFSWIGSTNAFILIGGGLFAGRLYDRGYLYVPCSFFNLCLNNAIIATIF